MVKQEKTVGILSVIVGVLIGLAAQGIYDIIFYFVRGESLDVSIGTLITTMVILLVITIIFTTKLYGAIIRKPEPPVPPIPTPTPHQQPKPPDQEKTNLFDYNALISDLILKIDTEKSLFKNRDEFYGQGWTILSVALLAISVIAVYFLNLSFVEKTTLMIAIVAIIATLIPTVNERLENRIVEANFLKAIKKFKIEKREAEKRVLLESLLKMKAINPTYKLETVNRIHPELFTKEKLLEKLFDSL